MVSKVVPIGILLLLSLSTLGQGTTRLRSAECRSGDKVSISVLVSDGKGSALLGLSSNNFKIRSNKNPVEVREFEAPGEPSSVGFLVDVSSWMQAHHVDIARRGMLKLVEKGHPDDEYFLVISGSKTTVRISSFSSGAVLRKIINEPKSFQSISGGKSVLYDGVSESLGLFESAKFKRKLLVVFGDGRSANSTISGDKLKELAATIATTVHFLWHDSG